MRMPALDNTTAPRLVEVRSGALFDAGGLMGEEALAIAAAALSDAT